MLGRMQPPLDCCNGAAQQPRTLVMAYVYVPSETTPLAMVTVPMELALAPSYAKSVSAALMAAMTAASSWLPPTVAAVLEVAGHSWYWS